MGNGSPSMVIAFPSGAAMIWVGESYTLTTGSSMWRYIHVAAKWVRLTCVSLNRERCVRSDATSLFLESPSGFPGNRVVAAVKHVCLEHNLMHVTRNCSYSIAPEAGSLYDALVGLVVREYLQFIRYSCCRVYIDPCTRVRRWNSKVTVDDARNHLNRCSRKPLLFTKCELMLAWGESNKTAPPIVFFVRRQCAHLVTVLLEKYTAQWQLAARFCTQLIIGFCIAINLRVSLGWWNCFIRCPFWLKRPMS